MASRNHAKLRRALEGLVARLRGDARSLEEQTRGGSGGQSGGDLSNAPMHLGDMGTDEYLHDLNTTLLENEEFIASESLEALHRMDAGRFGICESCQKPIADERLEAIPYARFCVTCAASQSSRSINVNSGRPNGPAETLAPEGEMDEDRPRKRQTTIAERARERGRGDVHAAGTAGGGTSMGGLAGMNAGHGDPQIAALQEATASGDFDAHEPDDEDELTPQSDSQGGAKEGTTGARRYRRESDHT
jgi:RNA polymerase-binding transcription factor DksA